MARKIMKIGTLLTAAIVSLSAVGGGLAVYVAVTKYETMGKVSEAQARLQIVRTLGDIPRYLNSERGFFSTASPDATGYNNVNSVGSATYQREVVKAQALKITSGSNAPNKKAPSMLWQMNQ